MRSFLIVCLCLGALAGGAFLAYYASNHTRELAQAVNTSGSVYGVVQSLPANAMSPGGPPQSSGWTPPATIPAHDNWTWDMGDGKIFNNVVITGMTPTQVTITHSQGVAHLPYNQLPQEVLVELHYPTVGQPAATTNAAGPGH